jgi:hypothetical protein
MNNVFRLQHQCDVLDVANQQFNDKFDQILADQADIVTYLQELLRRRGQMSLQLLLW